MKKIKGMLLGLTMLFVSGCANMTPAEQKAFDIAGCFGGTVTSAVESFISMLLTDAFKGASPDWTAQADSAISIGGADALPDIACALSKAMSQASTPTVGAAVNPDFMKGLQARVRYIQKKVGLTVQKKL